MGVLRPRRGPASWTAPPRRSCARSRVTAAELARRPRVSPATISRAVALLKKQALIRRGRDGRHRRDGISSTTTRGSAPRWSASTPTNGTRPPRPARGLRPHRQTRHRWNSSPTGCTS
ncbi:MarR family transcriptional regulator [Streptomyces sp. NPDC057743]|uniref:MarR family transcriptional regulator n=1 Tax=Streptomyces sp. NPDC057743 TaxID=3346236 RepID=UPI0036B650F0